MPLLKYESFGSYILQKTKERYNFFDKREEDRRGVTSCYIICYYRHDGNGNPTAVSAKHEAVGVERDSLKLKLEE